MIITLSQGNKQFRTDIKVNREQKISDTLLILEDGGVLDKATAAENRIFSERLEEYIDIQLTYQQAGIYNGDILYIR